MDKPNLPDFLENFNISLLNFQQQYPKENWSESFTNSLVNDYSFFSVRVEDSHLQYGDTIRFLNNETIRAVNLNSLMLVSEHQTVLKNVINHLQNFSLTEETIKEIHASLMESPFAWETEFKLELIGKYRNINVVGSREPFFTNKEYVPHYNLETVMASYIDILSVFFLILTIQVVKNIYLHVSPIFITNS